MINLFAMILALCSVWITPVSTEVMAGANSTIEIEANFPCELHTLVLHVNYDVNNITINDIHRGNIIIPEDAMCIIENTADSYCTVGIVCPNEPISGTGTLLSIDYTVSKNCTEPQVITVVIDECFYAPLGGGCTPINCEGGSSTINIVRPTTSAALRVLRAILGLLDTPEWADVNNDGVVNSIDVLDIIRIIHSMY